ncbi:MAG: potassium channel family protein [bacterium]
MSVEVKNQEGTINTNYYYLEDTLSSILGPQIPDKIKKCEIEALEQKRQNNFKDAARMFSNLANWYESQNMNIYRKKWEIAAHYHYIAGECFSLCMKEDDHDPNWHELACLEFTRCVECNLNNPEDSFFYKEAFDMAIAQCKLISQSKGLPYHKTQEAESLSTHYINIIYKKIIRMLDEQDFLGECDQLCIEYSKWKAYTSKYTFVKVWTWFWGLTSNYGTSVIRWVCWCFFVIIIYASFYYFTALQSERGLVGLERFIERLYFSVVTFTTLGFGDILPSSSFGMCLVISEVVFGYLMFWVLMTILAKKLFR